MLVCSPARAGEELPPDAQKIIDDYEDRVAKAEEALRKAQVEAKTAKETTIARLDKLAKSLRKQGKDNQAASIEAAVTELRTGRMAGARPDPGTLTTLAGQMGKSFLFEVTGANNGSVWGTDAYTTDSALATAAVHAGILKVGEKGTVKVTLLAGQPAYQGSTRNGVTTHNWNAYGSSYSVEKGRRIIKRKVPPARHDKVTR
jgi:hypothetical protein